MYQTNLGNKCINTSKCITLPGCFHLLLHRLCSTSLGRTHLPYSGIALWVYETDMNVLDCHNNHEKKYNSRLDSHLSWRVWRSLVRYPRPPWPSHWRRSPRHWQPSSWRSPWHQRCPGAGVVSTVVAAKIHHLEAPQHRWPSSCRSPRCWTRRTWWACLRSHRRYYRSYKWHCRTL
jgi:hypothetical protein